MLVSNKSKRRFIYAEGETLEGLKTIEIKDSIAERLIKMYPSELEEVVVVKATKK